MDAYSLPTEFDITGGEVHDCKAAPELIAKLPATQAIIADKGYDSEPLQGQTHHKALNQSPQKAELSKHGGRPAGFYGCACETSTDPNY